MPNRLVRLSVAILAAALAACAGISSPPGRVADASAPPRSAFRAYSATEVAAAPDPHDHQGAALCQRCHLPDLTLVAAPNALCRQCHSFKHGNHPVDVVQKTPAAGLPLLEGGRLACHSCHNPHRAKAPLRRPFNELCKSCHSRH